MHRRTGRRNRRRFHQGRAVPGIRRYLFCLRSDASDTDSDSIPLSSLLDDTGASLLTEMNNDAGSINPAICTGFMQMYSPADAGVDPMTDTRQLLAHRMSVVRSAMPLFTEHLQLPLFTGRRRWHTMFGQLSELTCSGRDTATFNSDEDILADSNFTSLFDSCECHHEPDSGCNLHGTHTSAVLSEGCQASHELEENMAMDVTENDFPTLDENADSMQSAVEQIVSCRNVQQLDDDTNCASPPLSVTGTECSSEQAVNRTVCNACCDSERTGCCGSQVRTLHVRRHSDPGSIHSSTTCSSSTNSNSDNWYYYDRRLRPGGALAAQYGRSQARRSLTAIVSPPAYDDAVYVVPTSTSGEQLVTLSEAVCDNSAELPPPYQEPEPPPSYTELTNTASEQLGNAASTNVEYLWPSCGQCWQAAEDNDMMTGRWSDSQRMFTGRPAVRWNRNTRVERWSSLLTWVMS